MKMLEIFRYGPLAVNLYDTRVSVPQKVGAGGKISEKRVKKGAIGVDIAKARGKISSVIRNLQKRRKR